MLASRRDCRKHAIDKAKSMTTHIAYPDELLDDKKLNEFYINVCKRLYNVYNSLKIHFYSP